MIAHPDKFVNEEKIQKRHTALGELERVKTLSNFQSYPAACTPGAGRFLRREIPFPESKNRYLTSFAPGDFEEILAKLARGR